MSALPPEADMLIVGINVCYVPIADISSGTVASQPNAWYSAAQAKKQVRCHKRFGIG